RATIKNVIAGGEAFAGDEIRDLKNSFAPSAFKEMTDQDKLSAPSYENQNSGVSLSEDDLEFDYGINRLVQYETILSDFAEEELGIVPVSSHFFKIGVSGGDAGRSAISTVLKNNTVKASNTVQVAEETFAVLSNADLSNAHSEGKVFSSRSSAD